jgi:hypothetical protein
MYAPPKICCLLHRHVLTLKDNRTRTPGKPSVLKPWFISIHLRYQEEELKSCIPAERGWGGSSRQMVLNRQRGPVKAQRVCHTIPVSGREKLNPQLEPGLPGYD